MRRSVQLLRGAKGRGWYLRYKRLGEEGFQKNRPPAPFDWSKTLPTFERNNASSSFSVTSTLMADSSEIKASNWAAEEAKDRPKVFFDVAVEEENLGRVVVELAHDVVPKTVENFMLLCRGTDQFSFKGTKVCDILKGHTLRLGDVETNDGTMSHSATGERYFQDENFIIPHTHAGLLSMVSSGVHSNGSQFYISLNACPHLNGRCVVFGRVIEGFEVAQDVEKVYSFRGTPARDIVITDCGILEYAGVELVDPPLSKVAVKKPTHNLPLVRSSAYPKSIGAKS